MRRGRKGKGQKKGEKKGKVDEIKRKTKRKRPGKDNWYRRGGEGGGNEK